MKNNIAIYAGSFDPLTHGHVDIVNRACRLFSKVYVAVARNSSKMNIFTPAERVDQLKKAFAEMAKVNIVTFEGLLVEYAHRLGATTLIRGIRTVSDFEYELRMAQSNRMLRDEIDTIFMITQPEYSFISSTLVREIANLGGDVSGMVPALIVDELRLKFTTGVTGAVREDSDEE